MILNAHGQPIKRPVLNREIATSGDGRDITADWIGPLRYPQDPVLRGKGYDYRIYEKLTEDDQVFATFEQRRLALTSRETEVSPGGKRKIDRMAADFIREQIDHLKWANLVDKKLFCRLYGFSVAESIFAADGRYLFADQIKVKKPRRFTFDRQGRLRLKTRQTAQGEPVGEQYPNKFWITTVGGDNDDDPFGRGFGSALHWPVFFKRSGIKSWLIFLEKFGQPTAAGKYSRNATDAEIARLMEALRAIQEDSAIAIPEGMAVELLEAARSGKADYEGMASRMDRAISKVVVGQTLTTDAGASLSQSKVHMSVRQDLVQADARLIDESFCDSIVKYLCALNFPGAATPKVKHRVVETDLKAQAERDKLLFDMGYRRTPESLAKEYGEGYEPVPPPTPTQLPPLPGGTVDLSEGSLGLPFATPARIAQTDQLIRIALAVKAGSLSVLAAQGILRLAYPEIDSEQVAAILSGEELPAPFGFQVPKADTIDFAEPLPRESTADVYARRLQRETAPIVQGWLDRIQEEIEKPGSLEDLPDRLDRLYSELDSESFAELLRDALIASRAAGWYEVQEQLLNFQEPTYRNLGFQEAIKFFRGKVNVPTERWDDLTGEEHDFAFVVAGATQADLLADLRAEVEKAIGSDGEGGEAITREEFAKNFKEIATRRGWDFKGGLNWRSDTIFGTNLRVIYATGRREQQTDPEVLAARPYWQWVHSDAPHPRPHHLALDGQVFRVDDPFWEENYPPNEWGCGCRVLSLSDRDLERLGKRGPDRPPKKGEIFEATDSDGRKKAFRYEADPTFAYPFGKSRQEQRRKVLGGVLDRLPVSLRNQVREDMRKRGLA